MRARPYTLSVTAVLLILAGGVAAQQDVSITTKDLMAGLSNPARWLTYSGDYTAQRHSPLKQITPANVGQLTAQWTFQTGVTTGFRTQFEATPIVIDGVIYQTGPGLFFVSARETCMTYVSQAPPPNYQAGDRTMGGSRGPSTEKSYGALRAIDPKTGDVKWELRHESPSWAGVLSTASGVVFTGTNEGHVVAADSRTGKELWRYNLGHPLYGAPSTYMADNRQYLVVPSGTTLTAFALSK